MEQCLGGRVGQSERVPGNVNKTERVRTKTGSNCLEQRERERVKEKMEETPGRRTEKEEGEGHKELRGKEETAEEKQTEET